MPPALHPPARPRKPARRALASALFGCLAVWSPGVARSATPEEPESALREYESIYPFYIELCAHTRILKKEDKGVPVSGNKYGHGGLYLKGACMDLREGYPLLKLCDPSSGETGVGVSTDYAYRSVSWIASPSRRFFYWGDLDTGARFTWARDLAIQAEATRLAMFTGVTASEQILKVKPQGEEVLPFLLDEDFGTDYAINLGRSSACARIPLSRAMVARIVEFLNQLNRAAHVSGNPFSGLGNNCVHTWHNALAAIDFWKPLHTNRPFPFDLFDLAIPYNQFVALMERGTRLDLGDPAALYRDDSARAMFSHWGRFPTGPGMVMELHPIWSDNEVFNTDTQPHFLDLLGMAGVEDKFIHMKGAPELNDLKTNLRAWRARFVAIQEARPRRSRRDLPAGQEFQDFLERYDRWLDAQVLELDSSLGKLEQ